jgi:hypothetical protein
VQSEERVWLIGPDIAIAYAARCYLRLSSLLPHVSDPRQVGRDVEALAEVMASCKYYNTAPLLTRQTLVCKSPNT